MKHANNPQLQDDPFETAIGDMEVARARWEKTYGAFMEDPSIECGVREMELAVVELLLTVVNLRRILEGTSCIVDKPNNKTGGTP